MNKIVLIILLVMISMEGQAAERDTIDYWHVYLNDVVIAKFNAYSEDLCIEIKRSAISKSDRLSLMYGSDTPCPSCSQLLVAKDEKEQILGTAVKNEPASKLSFTLSSLLATGDRQNSKEYYFYFQERAKRKMVFQVRFLE